MSDDFRRRNNKVLSDTAGLVCILQSFKEVKSRKDRLPNGNDPRYPTIRLRQRLSKSQKAGLRPEQLVIDYIKIGDFVHVLRPHTHFSLFKKETLDKYPPASFSPS